MKKRTIAILLTAAMLAGTLSGCGNGDGGVSDKNPGGGSSGRESNVSNEGGETLPEDSAEETITFSTWMPADDYKVYNSYSENPVVQYLNKQFNVVMEFQQPPIGAESDNFQLMLGTGDYTDVMNTTYSTVSNSVLYEDGVIIDIAPYIEQYMPNYHALLQENDELRKMVYDDEGHAFGMYNIEDLTRNQWGGVVYRRDILETMTGGNVAFPSGNEDPVTVEDWDYMLPLMKTYFDNSGLAETACVVIPACGYILTGELVAGFGTSGSWQLSKDRSTVEYGPVTDEFYHYVAKMREWYEAGYVYQDFASRTNDLFYLPNTSLTYGGAAGTWMGLLQQVGTLMSLPEYGLNVDVRPVTSPLDTENGIESKDAGFYIFNGVASTPFCISTTCEEDKIARILTVFDYLYSEEGGRLRGGLNAEQAAESEIYQKAGMTGGAYWYDEEGRYCVDERMWSLSDNFDPNSFTGSRLPGGTGASGEWPANKERTENDEMEDLAGAVWVSYGRERCFPSGAVLNAQESTQFNSVYTSITDYVNRMIPQFIMGTEDLTEDSWKAYVEQVNALGLDKANEAYQSALDRYNAR